MKVRWISKYIYDCQNKKKTQHNGVRDFDIWEQWCKLDIENLINTKWAMQRHANGMLMRSLIDPPVKGHFCDMVDRLVSLWSQMLAKEETRKG